MEEDTVTKEIMVSLKDMQTLDPTFDKVYTAVFIQQDKRYVDVLVYTEVNSYTVLSFNPESTVKFTLKNLKTAQIHGTCYLVLRTLKDISQRYAHVLPLDGRTYHHLDIGDRKKPNIKMEYQWKNLTNEHLLQRNPKTLSFDNRLLHEVNLYSKLILKLINILGQTTRLRGNTSRPEQYQKSTYRFIK